MKFNSCLLISCILMLAGCGQHREVINECPDMSVSGWSDLLAVQPFNELTNRKDTHYNALARTSQTFLGDSNYSYKTLLTLTYSHQESFISNAGAEKKCLMAASLLTKYPLEDKQIKAIDALTHHLLEQGVPTELVQTIKVVALSGQKNFELLGKIGQAELKAGTVEHGGRGKFFLVEIKTPELIERSTKNKGTKK